MEQQVNDYIDLIRTQIQFCFFAFRICQNIKSFHWCVVKLIWESAIFLQKFDQFEIWHWHWVCSISYYIFPAFSLPTVFFCDPSCSLYTILDSVSSVQLCWRLKCAAIACESISHQHSWNHFYFCQYCLWGLWHFDDFQNSANTQINKITT